MALSSLVRIKAFLLVSLLFLIPLSSGMVEGFREGKIPYHSLHKDGMQIINTRKLLMDVLDYDDTGANSKHDPRRRGGKP